MGQDHGGIDELLDAIDKALTAAEEDGRLESVREVAEELEAEYKEEFALAKPKGKLGRKLGMPAPETVISYDHDNGVLSRYADDVWRFWHNGRYESMSFRRRSEKIESLDFSGSVADHLVQFAKAVTYFCLPGNNPFSTVRRFGSAHRAFRDFQVFLSYLLAEAYLLNPEGALPTPLRLLDADTIKNELKNRMATNCQAGRVTGVFRSVTRWLQIDGYVELPAEFRPGFTMGEWKGDRIITKLVARYEAERITPWQAIPHDELMLMLQECQFYVQDFSDDILFMHRTFIETNLLFGKKFTDGHYPNLELVGKTKPLAIKLLKHQFCVDTRTGKPWHELFLVDHLKRRKGGAIRYGRINRTQCNKPLQVLIDCCVFLLALWSATRVRELANFKVDGLFINGKRLNQHADAVASFKCASEKNGNQKPRFELEFRTFKTSKEKTGKLRKIPLAKDAAHAFCLLVELQREYRTTINSQYLLPAGGTARGGLPKHGRLDVPVSDGYVGDAIDRLCARVRVGNHHPHKCRKTLATIIINKNPQSLELIQRLLGHHTPTMTLSYLMEIPGIAEPIRQHIINTNRERIVEILKGASTGRLSGRGAVSILEAIPPEKLVAEILPDTVKAYTEIIGQDPNFVILKAPAAFCLRIWKNMPENVPCLPKQNMLTVPVQDMSPDPSLCRPWDCGYAVHARRHLGRARRNMEAAQKLAGNSGARPK